MLYTAWVSIALWDPVRQDRMSTGRRIGWMAAILLVPLAGPIAYYVAGRSPIPVQLRIMLVAGGLVAYIAFAVIGIAVGP